MTIDRLNQSRRASAAARTLGLTIPRGMALWNPEWADSEPMVTLKDRLFASPLVHPGYLIDLRDPTTRAGLPLLVAEVAGVDMVYVAGFWNGERFSFRVETYCDNSHIEKTDHHHPDRTEAYLLFLEELAEGSKTNG